MAMKGVLAMSYGGVGDAGGGVPCGLVLEDRKAL